MGERFNIKDIDKERYIAIPMALFTQENYAGLDNTARLIYGFLKSRLNLSRINKWFDESGDIFFIAKISEMADFFGISKGSVSKKMAMLEDAGLLERKKMGGHQADRLYLRKISSANINMQNNVQVPLDSSIAPSEEVIHNEYGCDDSEFPAGNPEPPCSCQSFPEETQQLSEFPPGNPEPPEFPRENPRVSCGKPINTRNNIQENKNTKIINNNKSRPGISDEQAGHCSATQVYGQENGQSRPAVDVVSSFLHDVGMNVKTIKAFLQTYSREKIIKAIEVLKQQKGIKNPAGFLRRALEEGYQPSVGRQIHSAKMGALAAGLQDDNVVMDFTTGNTYRIEPLKPVWELGTGFIGKRV
ncbi:replication initiator protein A [Anaerovibrio sp.]|uniref:replication initiator protein A n=1 Tax=Anaerovibrio sp. TaxID=1872532 RepID=UPI003F15A8AF